MAFEPSGRTAPEPRWLSSAQQRAWRAYMDGGQRLLAELNRQLQRDSDLSLAEYRILVLLSEAPDHSLRMSDLADGVLSSRSRLTHQVRRMEEQGMVRRTSAEEDGRGVRAHLTEEGMRRLRAAAPGHVNAVRRDFIDLLTPTQLAVIGEVFDQVDKEINARGNR
ncbi:MarR family winged helix-turn-helix transcriptional regulator [Nocardia wallacei]|uniref:MarR family winged helix-turn-helix transcriptional regulator n=1 Tax=Nocardia wallacei TaxID=480035 RepID=UPI0024556C32|nr:MarR family transcriptional regulator [Nocardia wallacei]